MLLGLFLITWLLVIAVLAVAVLVTILVSGIVSNAYGAPYVPIRRRFVRPLLLWAGLSADDVFYDLGCGDARVLVSAVKDFGVKKAIGYEVALWPYLIAKWKIYKSNLDDRIEVNKKSFFESDLSGTGFVYAYLFPKLVDRLASKLAGELRVGAKILCPSFPIDLAKHPEFKLLKSEKIDKITAYLYEKI